MARSVFIVLCLAGILLCNLHARESDSRPEASAPVRLLKTAAGDLWHVASAPLRLSRRDALMVSSLAAVQLGLIYGGDGHLDREFGGEAHASYLAPAEELADIGDLYDRLGPARVFTGLWTGFLSGGILLGDKKMRETALLLLESGVITTTITYLGKGLFGRARPFTGQGARQFSLFSFSKDGAFRALPSGHTSGAFAMMTVIARQYPQWYVRYPAYAAASSVALQRMNDRKHWASDVVLGGAIGYWVASTIVDRHQERRGAAPVFAIFTGSRIGIAIRL